MTDCIFCKIVAGQVPCHRVYEDEAVLAFLDIGPVSRGHLLVVPKVHAETLDALPVEAAEATGRVLGWVGGAIVRATGATAWNVLQNNGEAAGQLVPHVHFHIIPRFTGDGFSYRWQAGRLTDQDAAELKAKMAAALR